MYFFLFNFASSCSRRLSAPAGGRSWCLSRVPWVDSHLSQQMGPLPAPSAVLVSLPCLSPAGDSAWHGQGQVVLPAELFPPPSKRLSVSPEGAAEIHSCLVLGNTECRESSAKRLEQIAASQPFRARWIPGAASEQEPPALPDIIQGLRAALNKADGQPRADPSIAPTVLDKNLADTLPRSAGELLPQHGRAPIDAPKQGRHCPGPGPGWGGGTHGGQPGTPRRAQSHPPPPQRCPWVGRVRRAGQSSHTNFARG